MARIAGVNIPNHQHAVIALTAIYGIGRTRSQQICLQPGSFPPPKSRTSAIPIWKSCATNRQVHGWKAICVAKFPMNIKRLMDLGCYRGSASSSRIAVPWSAYTHQCTYPQRFRASPSPARRSNLVRGTKTWQSPARECARKLRRMLPKVSRTSRLL